MSPSTTPSAELFADFLREIEAVFDRGKDQIMEMALAEKGSQRSLLQATLQPAFQSVTVRLPDTTISRTGRRINLMSDLFLMNGDDVIFKIISASYKELTDAVQHFSMIVRVAHPLPYVEFRNDPHEIYKEPLLALLWLGQAHCTLNRAVIAEDTRLQLPDISVDATKVLIALQQSGGDKKYVKSIEVYLKSHGNEHSDMPRPIRAQLKKAGLIQASGGSQGGIMLTAQGAWVAEKLKRSRFP